ncbi:MAG: hypothetical protein IKH67_01860, partial [Lachnospiraceae bacterium]|nr:hypothetical protein [Lachnospiraceae bacterium]
MISTGIFTGYYPYTLEETIKRIKAQDFSCVQLDVSFKDFDSTKEPMTKEKAHWIRDAFRDANLPIIAVSAYTNFIHPDPVKSHAVAALLCRCGALVAVARILFLALLVLHHLVTSEELEVHNLVACAEHKVVARCLYNLCRSHAKVKNARLLHLDLCRKIVVQRYVQSDERRERLVDRA